ncbi:TetR/AcrR family transcriptional regulator [Streptomyces sp. H34-S4]|uniref:TetR/AcrR family transcriptional regulator n=1 Tax=Streptomyces sp. H34-S4 TaxID=2996463 RepID=UPI00226E74E4|nr:TetR/AcrR family transcriptional regulator [Streptomyces sp. H34-S4]MCY0934140.1 TetR/AcrR family transcriptional regulator [Streptomyces sp. H34-S4]
MPKRVDHEERRTQITEALIRVAGRRGLHAVGMRDVAAEAGVSLRLVQYYFQTKEKLLFYGLQHLTDRFTARVGARLAAAGPDPGPRATIEALLLASLPTDEESRTFHLLYSSYSILSVTDEALAAQPFIDNPDAAENALAGLIGRAQESGLADPEVDARKEAISLLAMAATMGTSILVGQRGPESAVEVLRHHLDRIFRTRTRSPEGDGAPSSGTR